LILKNICKTKAKIFEDDKTHKKLEWREQKLNLEIFFKKNLLLLIIHHATGKRVIQKTSAAMSSYEQL